MGSTLQKTVIQDPSSATEEVIEIDFDEFEQAEDDPRVNAFLAAARQYGSDLEREGRNL